MLIAAECVTRESELAALVPEWQALWQRAPGATPFQAPEWLLPWWEEFGTGSPRVAVLRDGRGMMGLLPLYRLEEGGARKLLPMGAGTSDYLDMLLTPEAPGDAADRLLQTALAGAAEDGVAWCDLPDLPPDAALLRAGVPRGWREEGWEGATCPVLALPRGARTVRDAVSRMMWRKLRLARNRAGRRGGWAARRAAPEEVGEVWAALLALHRARWSRRGVPEGVLCDPRVVAWHEAALPRLAAAGMLGLWSLRIEGGIAAVYYTLRAGDRLLFYLSGFDEAWAEASPGTLLMGEVIADAIAAGARELHFLRGGEAYKYLWGAVDRRNRGRRLVPG